MSKPKTIDYLGIRATGATVREAKEDACQKLRHLADHYIPRVLSYDGLHAVLYATPEGFAYTLIHENGKGGCSMGNWANRSEAYDAVMRHLVQSQWRPQTLADCEDVPDCIEKAADRKFLCDYMRTGVYWRLLQRNLGLRPDVAWAVATKDHWFRGDIAEYLRLTPEYVESLSPVDETAAVA